MKRIILIGLLSITTQVFAESAAKVLYTQNKVTASHGGSTRTLSRGSALEIGDEIATAAGAAIHLQYSNGTLVNIGSNSSYKIHAYAPKQGGEQINAELTHGKLEIQNGGKIKETLKTPIVSLAILGTHIRVDATKAAMASGNPKNKQCAGARATENTYVQVLEGLVSARDKLLRPGKSVRVTCDRIVDAPFPPDGIVNSPLNAPGKIETMAGGAAADTTVSDEGALIATYVATNQGPGTITTSSIDSIQAVTAIADISLACGTF
ncbi:FecR family protein [Legionella saoudiensis]|uniref:FecR family protein n=1 Tax=Legionella saoudiensis TaxID=1750561 RepID=UPI000731D2E5|nr:FecR family protein [Legionella saoudiensis]